MSFEQSFPICEALQERLGFSGVFGEHVLDVLPAYKDMLSSAVERSDGENAWPDIVEQLQEGYWQLWITRDSAAITTIKRHGQIDVCVVIYMGGVLKDAQACLPGIQEWAKSMGCKRLHIEGRKGWERALKDLGAKLQYYVYSMEI